VGLTALMLLGLLSAFWWSYRFRTGDRIAPHVKIEGLEVGGLRRADAVALLRQRWAAARPSALVLVGPEGQWRLARQQLGERLRIDQAVEQALRLGRRGPWWNTLLTQARLLWAPINIRVTAEVDRGQLEAALRAIARQINREPVNARVKVVDGQVRIIPEQPGRLLDLAASEQRLAAALTDPHCQRVVLVVRTAQPTIRADDLRHFDTILSEYSTPFNPNQRSRSHNLRLGISLVHETVLLPGQEFSLNAALGPRVRERGYRDAPTIVDGKMIDTPGGGVCQIATTLYNAALLAGLEVVERHHHSRPIAYCPAGRDAAVVYGGQDLRFRNNGKYPLLLLGWVRSGRLYVRIVGNHEDKVDVELQRSGLQTMPPPRKEIQDPLLAPGQRVVEQEGRAGLRVTLSRIIRRDGQLVKHEVLHTDVYAPEARIVRVGPPRPPLTVAGQEAARSEGARGGANPPASPGALEAAGGGQKAGPASLPRERGNQKPAPAARSSERDSAVAVPKRLGAAAAH
jgi:vancomycin resistance protein YoaR